MSSPGSKERGEISGVVRKAVAEILRKRAWNIRAIVVFGSVAIGENVPSYSDLDLFVVTKLYDPFLAKRVGHGLNDSGISVEVQITQMPLFVYRRIREVGVYEVRERGQIVYGNETLVKGTRVTDPSMIPRYEAIRYLFNIGIMGLNMVLSKEFFQKDCTGKLLLTKRQKAKLLHQCHKSYCAACAALLLLKGEYRIGCENRASHFKELFHRIYRPLTMTIPNLDQKFEKSSVLCRTKDCDAPLEKSIAFLRETINDLSEVSIYCLSNFFGTNCADDVSLLSLLEELPRAKFSSLLYALKYFLDFKRLPPIASLSVEPEISCYIAGASVLFASRYSDDGFRLNQLTKAAGKKTREIYSPLTAKNNVWEIWDETRKIGVLLLKERNTITEYHLQ